MKQLIVDFFFKYESLTDNHEVYLIETSGVAKPSSEIKYIDYFTGSNLKVSNATWEILQLYHATKVT